MAAISRPPMPGMENSDSTYIEPDIVISTLAGRYCAIGTKAFRTTWRTISFLLERPFARAKLI